MKALNALYAFKGLGKIQAYFNSKWDDCNYALSQFERKGLPTFNVRTTNHLECFHRYLKKEVDATKTLQSCFKTVCDFTDAKNERRTIEELMEEVSYAYNINDSSPVSKSIHDRYTPKAIDMMLDQKKQLPDKKKRKLESTDVKGPRHLVMDKERSYLVQFAVIPSPAHALST